MAAADGRPLKGSHRRPHKASLDGPFPIAPGEQSTRAQQMSKHLRVHDSGLGPGEYEGAQALAACKRHAPAATIGRAPRGAAAPPQRAAPISVVLRQIGQDVAPTTPGPDPLRLAEGRACLKAAAQPCPLEHAASAQLTEPQPQGLGERLPAHTASSTPTAAGPLPRRPDMRLAVPSARLRPALPPQKAPPEEVARSAAHCPAPGDWDWGAVSRASCNTFTMQGGGAFRHDRARFADEPAQQDAHRAVHATANGTAASADRDHLAVGMSAFRDPGAAMHGSVVADTAGAEQDGEHVRLSASSKAVAKLEQLDPAVLKRRSHAQRAAEQAQAARTRRQRWEIQSALLPFLKREAMQAEGLV